jgi:hypothetical protein
MITRWIEVSFRKAGIHYYPGCDQVPSLEPVAYLANRHRHLFHFNVRIEVFHNDRELEFIMVQEELIGLFDSSTIDVNGKSCEMLAEDLIEYIRTKYTNRNIIVKVFEDGENGAVLEYVK